MTNPADEDTYIKEVKRAEEANRIIENPLFKEAAQAVMDRLNAQILNSGPEEWKYRENVYFAMKGGENFLGLLVQHIQTGQLAQESLDVLRK